MHLHSINIKNSKLYKHWTKSIINFIVEISRYYIVQTLSMTPFNIINTLMYWTLQVNSISLPGNSKPVRNFMDLIPPQSLLTRSLCIYILPSESFVPYQRGFFSCPIFYNLQGFSFLCYLLTLMKWWGILQPRKLVEMASLNHFWFENPNPSQISLNC